MTQSIQTILYDIEQTKAQLVENEKYGEEEELLFNRKLREINIKINNLKVEKKKLLKEKQEIKTDFTYFKYIGRRCMTHVYQTLAVLTDEYFNLTNTHYNF